MAVTKGFIGQGWSREVAFTQNICFKMCGYLCVPIIDSSAKAGSISQRIV